MRNGKERKSYPGTLFLYNTHGGPVNSQQVLIHNYLVSWLISLVSVHAVKKTYGLVLIGWCCQSRSLFYTIHPIFYLPNLLVKFPCRMILPKSFISALREGGVLYWFATIILQIFKNTLSSSRYINTPIHQQLKQPHQEIWQFEKQVHIWIAQIVHFVTSNRKADAPWSPKYKRLGDTAFWTARAKTKKRINNASKYAGFLKVEKFSKCSICSF